MVGINYCAAFLNRTFNIPHNGSSSVNTTSWSQLHSLNKQIYRRPAGNITVIIVLTTSHFGKGNLQLDWCEEPENLDQMKANLNSYPKHDSFLNVPPERNLPTGELKTLEEIQNKTPQFVSIELEPEYGRTSCSAPLRHHHHQIMTTCPWYFARNTDVNRYPRTIIQAICSCEQCLEFMGDVRTQNQCKPIPNFIRVLRRVGCSSGRYEYAMALEPMPTGCTCTSAILRYSHNHRAHNLRPRPRD
ncbi:interleukin-17A-like [Liolophura sinensis]|uniref:interleukin-17A-like n=1 Tax=Liolophura sinensis TaxID=3198878 RepID=UPI003159112B